MIDVETLDPPAKAAVVLRSWEAWLERMHRREAPPPRTYVYASAWRACERRMVFEMTAPTEQAPVPTDTLARFRRGNDRERDLLADLVRIGREVADPPFHIENQQAGFHVPGRAGVDAIHGKIDGKLRFEGQKVGAPLEVKAWASTTVERIEVFEDVFESPWTRSGGYQLLSYLYGHDVEYGYLLLDRSGIPRLLLVELTSDNYARMEEFLARAERAIAHAVAGTLPDYITDAAECKRCPFYGTACQPPIGSDVQQVLTDPEVEALLERWWALREPGKQWAHLDEQVKKRLRGIESAVAGHFAISGKWSTYTKVVLPPEIKQQFTIADPKGRFSLEVERL